VEQEREGIGARERWKGGEVEASGTEQEGGKVRQHALVDLLSAVSNSFELRCTHMEVWWRDRWGASGEEKVHYGR
jgi:hypothetical protein